MKQKLYEELVKERKSYKFKDSELLNPSEIKGGIYDKEKHLNPWAQWHGNLDARILLIGQDWSNEDEYIKGKGEEDYENNSNLNLKRLFKEIDINVSDRDDETSIPLYFTNCVLGIKKGQMARKIKSSWYLDTADIFIKPLIDIINPKIIIALGKAAYKTVSKIYNIKTVSLKYAINENPIKLPDGKLLFAVYHCSALGLASRNFQLQLQDWRVIKKHL
jgi:DNA polymerase